MTRLGRLLLLATLSLRCATPGDPAAPDTTTGDAPSTGTTGTSTGPPTTGLPDADTTGEDSTSTGADTTGGVCNDPAVCPPVCDTISQDCPGGLKCTGVKPGLHDPFTGTACVPDNGGQGSAPGGICINAADGSDTCDAGSMCMQFGSGEGACLGFCVGPPDSPTCADPAMTCARVDRLWPISLCVPRCDPLAYDCPDLVFGAAAMVCAPGTDGFGCVLRGNLDGHPLGQPCVQHRDCIAAAHCAPAPSVPGCTDLHCCAAYCDLTTPTCPLAGQDCVPYHAPGQALPGLEDVGLCAAPG